MNIAKIKKSIDNLKKIREIVEISKFDTLHKLQKTNKITNTFMRMAVTSKNIIEFAANKYWAKSPLLKNNDIKKTLWIFASVSSQLLATSYSQQIETILNNFNFENDEILVIGKPAIQFSKEHNFNILYKEENINKALEELPVIIGALSSAKETPNIKFISHNSYLVKEPIIILPILDFNINIHVKPINKKIKFFPSLTDSISNLGSIYSERLTEALLREAKYFYLKEKLIRHEGSLKSVDSKIEEKTNGMIKLARKIETEELILVSQIAKREGTNE